MPYVSTRLYTDADNGSDVATTKSTSGCFTSLQGPRTFIPAYWFARKQGTSGISSGDTEVQALRDNLE